MRIYQAKAGSTKATTDGIPLNPRHDLMNHSPDGFAWGYQGSGPAQFALAILADFVDDSFALAHYQQFKADIIANLPQNEDVQITGDEIYRWIGKNHETYVTKIGKKEVTDAAEAIYEKYERYLGASHMGNQDRECCIQTIATIISHYCG